MRSIFIFSLVKVHLNHDLNQNNHIKKMSFKRGALIVIEGVDRSGKSTQCRKLVESLNLRNIPAELISFPDRSTPTGQIINKYLSDKTFNVHDKAIHLLFSANRWENALKIKELVNSGTTLIVDRYSYSGIAYSAIKKDMDINWCKTQEIGLPKPDIVFLLTISKEEMEQRPGFGTERYESDSIQSGVLKVYNELKDSSWEVIDAGRNIEEVHKSLLDRIINVVDICVDKPLEKLDF